MGRDSVLDNQALKRIEKFRKSGQNPLGWMVSAETLRAVIRQAEDVSEETKVKVIAFLEEELIEGEDTVDSFLLGLVLGSIPVLSDQEFLALCNEIRDLNKLPLVSINGKTVS